MRLLTTLAATLASLLPITSLANNSPNVLLVIADDMGIDASSCYSLGSQQANMPNIEAMCEQGIVFENSYSAPVCSPTRATIMTGQYGFRTGVGAAIPKEGTNGLSADTTSLFDVLEKSDYSNNLLGKWHLASSGESLDHPARLGVPDYFGLFKGGVRDYYKWGAVDKGGESVNVTNYSTTEITDQAISWIEKQKQPWFLWLAYNAPHTPFHLPPDELHTAGKLPTAPKTIKDNPLPYYNAMLEALDSEIGRLFDSMNESTRNNTIVMFVGDNGSPNQVTKDLYGNHASKGTIYDSGTHVPLIVTGPGIKPGRSDAFVMTVDFFSTITNITGVAENTPDSFDFSPVLYGGETERDYIYVEHFQEDKSDSKPSDVFGWAVREGNYKLVQIEGDDAMLFDLTADPLENNDLLADGVSDNESVVLNKLRERYNSLHAQ
ncbi:sulfatase-like hydrolase/transferase [Photobacterium sp. DNB23_23_1]